MPEQAARKKFEAVLEIRIDLDVLAGSTNNDEWAPWPGMFAKILMDMLPPDACDGFERYYGTGLKLKVRVTDIMGKTVDRRY